MTTTQTTATLTVTETDSPSRSKQAGPCWIAVDGTYASPSGRTIDAEVGSTVTATGKATLRRATRTTTDRETWTLVVTGDPADVVTLSVGSPQSVDATVTGVRFA
jgi:hypothetical protein